MDWKKYAWVRRGKRRSETLDILNKASRPLTIKDIHMKSKVALSQASLTVAELCDKELIHCLNPEDKIGKLYTISEVGKQIVLRLENERTE